jgi:hypothetical protein
MQMSDKNIGRKAKPSLTFSGKKVDTTLKDYLQSVTYTDVASGSSDTLSITLHNIDGKWLNQWYPTKGNTVSGSIKFLNWNNNGKDKKLSCGSFTMDDIKFSFGPKTADFSCISQPAAESFRTRERDKTWEKITIKGIATEICSRYGLKLAYSATSYTIDKLEQSNDDCSFLSKLCEDYGLAMKIYKNKIVVYDQTTLENKASVATLNLKDFEEGGPSITDSIYGTYTGARVSYKPADGKDEISVFVGLKAENAKGSRVLKVNETCSSEAEALIKGAAQVNKSNRSATTISGGIFPNPKICAGVCITLGADFGKLKGKYFVDKVTWTLGGSATSQKIEAHKVQKKAVAYKQKTTTAAATTSTKSYKVGDIVNFKGGTHYVSSYSGAKGYNARAGKAKITIANGSGKAHPWHLIHTDSTSNVYGWVDDGTFE